MAKNLDHELEQALRATDDDAARAVVAPVREEGPSKASTRRSVGLLAGLLGAFALVIGVALFGFKEAAIYAMPADQVVARSGELAGRRVRVEGVLVPGTLVKRDDPCEYRFVMKSGETQLPVRYPQCVIPDTFRDRPEGGVEVTVEGTVAAKTTEGGAQGPEFQATLVMAKCASKYDPATKEMIESDGTRRKATQSEIEAAGQPVR